MEVKFKPEVQEKLDRAAAQSDRTPGDYVEELVEIYLDHDLWFREKVKVGLDQLDRGDGVPHDQIAARIEKMFAQ